MQRLPRRQGVRGRGGLYRYLLPHPKVNGKHVLCDAALEDLSALAVDGNHDAKAEYHKHIPTCAVSS